MMAATQQHLSSGIYDFIDFGCSKGESLAFGRDVLGGRRGLGIDIDPRKVEASITRGEDALVCDATKLDLYPDSVSFSIMSHFLEHLPGLPLAMQCIESAASISRDYVFIRQPWFDSDGELMRRGLKLYWSDWAGHRNPMTTLDFYRAIRNLKLKKPLEWAIYGNRWIRTSADRCVLPLGARRDSTYFDPAMHGSKPFKVFNFPVFAETICIIKLSDGIDIDKIVQFTKTKRFSSNPRLIKILNSKFLLNNPGLIRSSTDEGHR
jgi:hypothetical protein